MTNAPIDPYEALRSYLLAGQKLFDDIVAQEAMPALGLNPVVLPDSAPGPNPYAPALAPHPPRPSKPRPPIHSAPSLPPIHYGQGHGSGSGVSQPAWDPEGPMSRIQPVPGPISTSNPFEKSLWPTSKTARPSYLPDNPFDDSGDLEPQHQIDDGPILEVDPDEENGGAGPEPVEALPPPDPDGPTVVSEDPSDGPSPDQS